MVDYGEKGNAVAAKQIWKEKSDGLKLLRTAKRLYLDVVFQISERRF